MSKFTFLYTSDLHGSDLCFNKAINASVFYKVDALVIGGDLAGKSLTVIVKKAGGSYETMIGGSKVIAKSGDEVAQIRTTIANSGRYPVVMTEEDYLCFFHEEKWRVSKTYELIHNRLQQWVWMAEKKLKPKNIRLIMICGNDDPWELDEVLANSSFVEFPENDKVLIDKHEILAESGGNLPSPFYCPRDMEEDALERRIREKMTKLQNPAQAICLLHIPPYNTQLDKAYALTEDLTINATGGHVQYNHVGSKAVRNVIEEFQPFISLHGHIHESGGVAKIDNTTCFNPGSDYSAGFLRSFIITLNNQKLESYVSRAA